MSQIDVVGLGAGDFSQLPIGVYRMLNDTACPIYARTKEHPVLEVLAAEGLIFESFDEVYEAFDTFDEVYETIVSKLLGMAKQEKIIYLLPGHPMVAERTVQLLLDQTEVEINIVGGSSFLDAMFTSLKIDPVEGFQLVDGTSFSRDTLNYQQHLIFTQVYDQMIASNVKLELLEDLPIDYDVYIVDAAGTAKEQVRQTTLLALDRMEGVNNLTSVYVPPVKMQLPQRFDTLKNVIATLRAPGGCDWDRAQTHDSLKKYLIEEIYELIEAIDANDDDAMVEELGDVLLQVMLHSQIGADEGYFTIDDVIKSITEKMIHRHPHVFGGDTSKTWEELKAEEKGTQAEVKSYFETINSALPSLESAKEIKSIAAKEGFDWTDVDRIWQKFDEEREEFKEAAATEDSVGMVDEFGDLLFVLVNIAKFYNLSPELAMQHANRKFMARFTRMTEALAKENKRVDDLTDEQRYQAWKAAKEETDETR